MKRSLSSRRAALAAMALVTAWSVWAWAHPRPTSSAPNHGAAIERMAAEAPAAHVEEEHEGPLPMNWVDFSNSKTPPFLAMLINFGILAGGFYYFGKAPVASALRERRDSIAKEIENAQRMKREAEARAKVYEEKLAHLEDEVRAAREALVRVGEAERDRIMAEVDAKAERMRKGAEFLVEQEMKQLRQDMLRQTVDAAVTAAESLLRGNVGPADQERIAEDYLKDLGVLPATIRSIGQSS